MDYKEKLAEAGRLFADAKAILEKTDATAEDRAKVPLMLEDAKRLKAEGAQLKDIAEAAGDLAERVAENKERNTAKAGAFPTLGHFLVSVAEAGNVLYRGQIDPRLQGLAAAAKSLAKDEPATAREHTGKNGWAESESKDRKDMAEGSGAAGGFLVPAENVTELYAVEPPPNSVRARATRIPMRRRQISVPVLNQTTTTAGVPHWFGGIQANWTEEAEEKHQDDPSFRQIQLVAHKLVCYTRASDELLDDNAVGLAAFLSGPMGFRGAIDWHEEYAFLRGTGAGQPLGILNAGATISVAAQQAAGLTITDLVTMLADFLPSGQGVWMMNQAVISNLIRLTDPLGGYVWISSAADGVPSTLFGMPVIFTEKLPRLGTAGAVVLADWRYYLVGDRQGTTIDSTNIERFRYDQTSWRAVHRVDGQPWLSAPLTLSDGTTQVSPFVMLGAKTT